MAQAKHNSEGQAKPQADKFADLARELECDEDEAAFDAKLEKVAKAKPAKEDDSHES
jgi:hypothetical protein